MNQKYSILHLADERTEKKDKKKEGVAQADGEPGVLIIRKGFKNTDPVS